MDVATWVEGLHCRACEWTGPIDAGHRCPRCDHPLALDVDADGLPTTRTDSPSRSPDGATGSDRIDGCSLTPFDTASPASHPGHPSGSTGPDGRVDRVDATPDDSSATPVVVVDESQSPTGSVADRTVGTAVAHAAAAGRDAVALPSTGPDAHAAAAAAARYGLDCRVAVPSRAAFEAKAMVNVYDADMTVVDGDAAAAAATADDLAAGATVDDVGPRNPFRRAGAAGIAADLAASVDPDVVVVPTGHGTVLAGIADGFRWLDAAGAIGEVPALVAAQPADADPIASALADVSATDLERSADTAPSDAAVPTVEARSGVDTVVTPVAVADPQQGRAAARAVVESGGTGITVTDEEALSTAVAVARDAGVGVGATGGVGLAAAGRLRADGLVDDDDVVAVLSPLTARAESDLLRSYLVSQGE